MTSGHIQRLLKSYLNCIEFRGTGTKVSPTCSWPLSSGASRADSPDNTTLKDKGSEHFGARREISEVRWPALPYSIHH